jgi:ankyrin repeat protein
MITPSANGLLPLHCAAHNESYEISAQLCSAFATAATAQTNERAMPFHLAAGHNRNLQVIKLLLEAAAETTPSQDEASEVHNKEMEEEDSLDLLNGSDERPDPICTTADGGLLPLHFAASSNTNIEVVKYLYLQHQEAVSQSDDFGSKPLHLAASGNEVGILQLLHQANPNAINHRNNDGQYPLHMVSTNTCVESTKYLLELNPQATSAQDHNGATPLHLAAATNPSIQIIRLLCDTYPNAVKLASNTGMLPLHWAARSNPNANVVRLLISIHASAMNVKVGRL